MRSFVTYIKCGVEQNPMYFLKDVEMAGVVCYMLAVCSAVYWRLVGGLV